MRDQKIIDFNNMIEAIDILCRFCDCKNITECLNCGVNKAVKHNWEKLNSEQKARCECPWNGIQIELNLTEKENDSSQM